MTFYEAALCILQREGKPLHVTTLTQLVIEAALLAHIGKTPQEVMESRLLAMARKRDERRVCITAPHTFALTEWSLPEDLAALELPIEESFEKNTGPLLRGRERDPSASTSKVRIAGRGERTRGQWREEDSERRRQKKPLAEVAIDIFNACKAPLSAVDLAAAARDRELISDDLGAEALVHALREENRRRVEAGRKPIFDFLPSGEIALRQEALDEANRTSGAQGRGDKAEAPLTLARLLALAVDQKKSALRQLRRRLGELDGQAFDKAMTALLERSGYLDLKVARRNRDGLVFVARRREGLLDLRCAIRVIRGSGEVGRAEVEDLRRGLSQLGSQLGVIVSAGEVTREAKQEAQSNQPLVFLLCADALAELCLDKEIGVTRTQIEFCEMDEDFFRRCGDQARDDRDRRRAGRERDDHQRDRRHHDRQRGNRAAEAKEQSQGSGAGSER
ncbi:MAG: restriction endonuclease [Myxococcales bacterium]|jgi:hypothetical protein|nr:restriction endonuclease [Myxococcales bacterium]